MEVWGWFYWLGQVIFVIWDRVDRKCLHRIKVDPLLLLVPQSLDCRGPGYLSRTRSVIYPANLKRRKMSKSLPLVPLSSVPDSLPPPLEDDDIKEDVIEITREEQREACQAIRHRYPITLPEAVARIELANLRRRKRNEPLQPFKKRQKLEERKEDLLWQIGRMDMDRRDKLTLDDVQKSIQLHAAQYAMVDAMTVIPEEFGIEDVVKALPEPETAEEVRLRLEAEKTRLEKELSELREKLAEQTALFAHHVQASAEWAKSKNL